RNRRVPLLRFNDERSRTREKNEDDAFHRPYQRRISLGKVVCRRYCCVCSRTAVGGLADGGRLTLRKSTNPIFREKYGTYGISIVTSSHYDRGSVLQHSLTGVWMRNRELHPHP